MGKKHGPGFLTICNDAKTRVRELTVEDVKQKIDAGESIRLVDVREESEFANGRIVGALHIGKGIIERDIEKLIPDQDAEIICYCGGGFRSALAADNLQKMGYTNVWSMDGGWSGWNANSFPVE